jgi:uncharacterized membrane protein
LFYRDKEVFMWQTVVGLYDDAEQAHAAVRELVEKSGLPKENISIVANDAAGKYAALGGPEKTRDLTTEGAAGGAVIGALTGIVVGISSLALPGIGAALVAGPLLGLIGAGIGATAGSLLGSLVHLGIPEKDAHLYAEGVRRGGTLVIVRSEDELARRVAELMGRYNPVDIERRAVQWGEEGWERYDPDRAPYTIDQIEEQRERDRARATLYTGGRANMY